MAPSPKAAVKAGATAAVKVRFQLANGYHTNSHTPSDEYLIPLRLTWDASPLAVKNVVYPQPHMEKYSFAEKPLSVFTGDFDITTTFEVPATAQRGPKILAGKLRYQACTDKLCYPPKTLAFTVPAEVR